ncbi:MAG: phage virion morphogenesis protein [Cyanobacteria bacterium P01_D01_bin.56]
MPVSIEITDDEINKALLRLSARTQNLKPVFDQFGPYLLDRIRSYFRDETEPDGTPWAPLSPSWQRRKKQEGRDRGIGRYTLSMLNGLAYDANENRLQVGSREPYAPAFQFGVPQRNQPARPFLGVTDADRQKLSEIIEEHLAD